MCWNAQVLQTMANFSFSPIWRIRICIVFAIVLCSCGVQGGTDARIVLFTEGKNWNSVPGSVWDIASKLGTNPTQWYGLNPYESYPMVWAYYCRQVKLDAGYPPKPKSKVYSELHRQILFYVAQFNQRFYNLQIQFYNHPGAYRNHFIFEVRHYLSAMSHLLCQEKKCWEF